MKRLLFFFSVIVISSSCEDVIDVETQPEAPRLVINGLIRVDTTQQFVDVRIQATETSDFFSENTVTQLDRAVILPGGLDSVAPSGIAFGRTRTLVEEEPGTGIYIPSFIPGSLDDRISTFGLGPGVIFLLIVEHRGREYAAFAPYSPTVPISNLEQGDGVLFEGDETEIIVTFTDVEDQEDYYVFDFGFGNFLAVEDQFIDGQEFEFSYFYDQEFEPGSEIEVSILGADLEFYNYMNLLVEQAEREAGVFETPVATVRGNVFDITGLDNIEIFDNVGRPNEFALGYFAVVQEFKSTLVIE